MAAGTKYGTCHRCGQIRPGPIPVVKAGVPEPFLCAGCLVMTRPQRSARQTKSKGSTQSQKAQSPGSRPKAKRAR